MAKRQYDPNKDNGTPPGAHADQRSAERQVAAAVAHLPKEIAAQFVAGAKFADVPAILGSVADGDYTASGGKRPSK